MVRGFFFSSSVCREGNMKRVNGKPRKSMVIFKFNNKELGCKCLYGKCPNYSSKVCGDGGIVIFKQYGNAIGKKKVRRLIRERKKMRSNDYGRNLHGN